MHSKLALELDRGLQRTKSGVGIPLSQEDRGSEQIARGHEAGEWLSWEKGPDL